MATIVLTVPSRGQVVAIPSGELVWRSPHIVLSLPADLLPPALLPPTPVPPVPDTIVESLLAHPNNVVYAPPAGDRQACTLQITGPGMPTRYCRCVIPCIRLKARAPRVVFAPDAPDAPIPRPS